MALKQTHKTPQVPVNTGTASSGISLFPAAEDHDHGLSGASFDHGALLGLGDDDHPQYALLAGRAGGQTLKGDTASGGDLTLMSTAHATKGKIRFGTSHYSEVDNRLELNTNFQANVWPYIGIGQGNWAGGAWPLWGTYNPVSGQGEWSGVGCGQDILLSVGEDAEAFTRISYMNPGQADANLFYLSSSGVLAVGPEALNGLSIVVEGFAGYDATNKAIRFVIHPTGGYDFTSERFRIGALGQWGIGGSATAVYDTANFGAAGNVMISGGAAAAASWFNRLVLSGDNMILGGGATASELRFLEPSGSGSNYTAFKAQAQAGNLTYSLPAAGPTAAGQILSCNLSGVLSWVSTLPGAYFGDRYFGGRYFGNRYFR